MSKKTIPEPPVKKNAFVHKLYSMLNDPKLSHLIWWTRNEESNTFALYPGKEFANALTGYFKHGNVASFVRQLHMYGFHKVSDPQSNDLSSNTNNDIPTNTDSNLNSNNNPNSNNNSNINNKDNPPIWEFKHSSGKFKKNDENSLIYIKRRSSSNSSRNSTGFNNENDSSILIPTSSPSPNSFDHLPHHTFHFGQHIPPPPQQQLHPSLHQSQQQQHQQHQQQQQPPYINHAGNLFYQHLQQGQPHPLQHQNPSIHQHPHPPLHQHPHQPPPHLHHTPPYPPHMHPLQYQTAPPPAHHYSYTSTPISVDGYQQFHIPNHQQNPYHQPPGHMQQPQQQQIQVQHPQYQQEPQQQLQHQHQQQQIQHPHQQQQSPPPSQPLQEQQQQQHSYSPLPDAKFSYNLKQSSLYNNLTKAEQDEKSSVEMNQIPRHNSDPQRRSLTPQIASHNSQSSLQNSNTNVTPNPNSSVNPNPNPNPNHPSHIQAQHYAPNLQFRKIWETSKQSRPRNPSLLFDPLAPAIPSNSVSGPSSSSILNSSSSHFSPNPENQSPISSQPPSSTVNNNSSPSLINHQHPLNAPPTHTSSQLVGSPYLPSRSEPSSFSSTRDSFASARDSFSSARDSFSTRDSIDHNRLSIKLPPPSSIHRASSNLSFPGSPGLKPPMNEGASQSLNVHNPSITASDRSGTSTIKLPRSIPSSIESSSSVPGSPSFIKKPSLVPINNSIHERLRPSLIELHFGTNSMGSSSNTSSGSAPSSLPGSASAPSSNTGSLPASISSAKNIMKLQHDSIGSHSSNTNSIFSNKSSLSSLSSAQRTSSFGSISHHSSWDLNKNSISIGPHDPIPSISSGMGTGGNVALPPETITENEVSNPTSSAATNAEPTTIVSPQFHKRSTSPSLLSSASVSGRPKIFRSLTPPNLHSKYNKSQIHSPIPRSSTSFQSSHQNSHNHHIHYSLNLFHSTLRSPTNSPLSKSVLNEETDDNTKTWEKSKIKAKAKENTATLVDNIKSIRSKVSVTSLLGDDTSRYSTINSVINESENETESEVKKENQINSKDNDKKVDENVDILLDTLEVGNKEKNQDSKRQKIG